MQFAWEPPPDLPRRILIAGAVVIASAIAYWWFSMPVSTTPAPVIDVNVVQSSTSTASTVVVDVVGSVRRPGVVRLHSGARVIDAVTAAGGLIPGKRAVVNLARVLVDGEQIVVGGSEMRSTSGGAADEPGGSGIHLNTSSASQLEALPGVGPVLAQRIVEYRTKHGPFAQIRDLLQVPGIGDAKYAELADAAVL